MRIVREEDLLLSSAASILSERVGGMQQAVDRIAGLAMVRSRPSIEMVVAFQAFDRLTQEFEALAEVLRRYARPGHASREEDAQRAIEAVPLADLRDRLAAAVQPIDQQDFLKIGATAGEDEKIF